MQRLFTAILGLFIFSTSHISCSQQNPLNLVYLFRSDDQRNWLIEKGGLLLTFFFNMLSSTILQSAALVSVGILFEGSAHQQTMQLLLVMFPPCLFFTYGRHLIQHSSCYHMPFSSFHGYSILACEVLVLKYTCLYIYNLEVS